MSRALIAGVLVVAGCATTVDTSPPAVALPDGWRSPARTTGTLADQPWTGLLNDPLADALIREALDANHDLRIAAQRVELARAQYAADRSLIFPTVAADASYTRQRAPLIGDRNVVSETSSLGIAMPSWEIDVWGRLRSLSESSRRQWLASEQNRRALYVSLVGAVASSYVQLVGLDDQIAIAVRTADSRTKSLNLVAARNRAGVASILDVRQAEVLVAGARQTIAELERERSLTENALSVVLGRAPGPIARAPTLLTAALPAELPAGIPSGLLERRADIVAAEEALRASALSVDAAKKAFLPTISLTAFLGFISPELRNLIEGNRTAWSLQPAINLPLFTAGRLDANVAASEAAQRIALEQYVQTVQGALRDVEDALVSYQRYREQRDALAMSVAANRERLRLTELRYVNGVSSYFEVLDSQRQLFDAELALSQATTAAHASIVQFYRALGGGWREASQSAVAATP